MWTIIGCALVLVLYVLWSVRARNPKGLVHHKTHPFFGITKNAFERILVKKECTGNQWHLDELHHNGWQTYGWSNFGGKNGLLLFLPEDIKFMLKDEFNNFAKGEEFLAIFDGLLGDGIFNVNGDKWKTQRVTMSHMFSRRQLRERMSAVFGTHAQDAVNAIGRHAESGEAFNIQNIFYCYTFDCINMIAFNREVDSLAGVQRDVAFQNAFDAAQQLTILRFIIPWWRLASKYLLTAGERDLRAAVVEVNKYVYDVVEGYYDENGEISDAALQGDQTMTGLFLEAAKEEGRSYDKKFLRDMILNTVIAGRDTTGSALTSCIEYLCQHPEWQDKLIEEAKTVFAGNTQEALTFDDMEGKSPIAEAVFLEALRLNPSVPANEKTALKDITFPSGVEAKKGMVCGWLPQGTNRYKKVWGPDAEKFDPSRWLGEKAKAYDDFMYPTFNAGPRLCLGKNMAILEGKTALLTTFAHFRFTAKKGFVPKPIPSATWQNDSNGMQVHAHRL